MTEAREPERSASWERLKDLGSLRRNLRQKEKIYTSTQLNWAQRDCQITSPRHVKDPAAEGTASIYAGTSISFVNAPNATKN